MPTVTSPDAIATDTSMLPPMGPARMIERAREILDSDTRAASALAAEAVACTASDSSLGGQALHVLGMSSCLLGRIVEGRAMLREAAGVLSRHGPVHAECHAWRDYGAVLTVLSGDVQAGLDALQRALALAEATGDPAEQGIVLSRMGPPLSRIGRADDARRVLERAVELLAGHGQSSKARASALDNLGHLLIQQREFVQAVAVLRTEHALWDPATERLRVVNCEANLAVALAGTGQAAEAQTLIDGIAPRLQPDIDTYQWADYLLSAGAVCLLLDDPASARRHLADALAAARRHELHTVETDVLVQLALAEERCGDLAAALASERELRAAQRKWTDEQTAAHMRALQAGIEMAEKRAENQALEGARRDLERRVEERTAALHEQMRERAAAEELARFWADHDWLTRLPNRRQLQVRLDAELVRARRDGGLLAVLFVDLDGFKGINDAHGHLAGDRILRLTARRLRRQAPAGAVVARFGGDEFVVLLPDLADAGAAAVAAQRLRAAVLAPLKLDRRPIAVSCSIGVAIGPRDAQAPDELLRRADRAMLEAKAAGRNQVCELDAEAQARLDRRGRLRRELGHAIEGGRLSAALQPLWDVQGQRLSGVELLARWHDPDLGWVSPAEFIPVAEESGQIGALGIWAIKEAVRSVHAMRAAELWPAGDDEPRVSVNVSTVQLIDPQLVERLVEAVAEARGQTHWIELELTESVQLAEDPQVHQRMRRLREAGFTLAIDDFGAGYSSFSYLGRQYFDRLKIDRALVSAATLPGDRASVTGSIIAMAHRLGLAVVAEGIETSEQAELLEQQGCDVLQGYGIARPMALPALLSWCLARTSAMSMSPARASAQALQAMPLGARVS